MSLCQTNKISQIGLVTETGKWAEEATAIRETVPLLTPALSETDGAKGTFLFVLRLYLSPYLSLEQRQ